MPSTLHDLLKYAVSSYMDEHKDLSDSWKSLDSKAQGTGSIAGIFLAGLFAWTRAMPDSLATHGKFLLLISLLLLIASAVASVLALKIREVSSPPFGERTARLVLDIKNEGLIEERLAGFMEDQLSLWETSNESLRSNNTKKAARVWFGQVALVTSIFPVAISSVLAIFYAGDQLCTA